MRKSRKGPADRRLWDWLFLLSFPLSIVAFLVPSLEWGTNSDDGWYYYEKGLLPWKDILGPLLIPGYSGKRVFVFGEDRPIQALFFKVMHEIGASPVAFHVISWFVTYVSCFLFAWGAVRLLRLAVPLSAGATGLLACLMWWLPAGQFSAATTLVSPWVLGFIGVFWGVAYSGNLSARVKWPLGVLGAFLACQTLEDAWPILAWTPAWLYWVRRNVSRPERGWKGWLPILAPALIVAIHILLFRSLDPAHANRPEVSESLTFAAILKTSRYYALMSVHAVASPFVDWMGLPTTATGVTPQSFPGSFLLTTVGLVLAFKARPAALARAQLRKLDVGSWLIILGGLTAIAPYLMITNRQFFYYGYKLNAFIALLLVFRVCGATKRSSDRISARGALAASLYFSGVILASEHTMLGWNYTKHFGQGIMKDFHARVMALPGARECTGQNPCCLEVPNRTWGSHEWMVDWIEGAGKNPPFVTPGMRCVKTLRLT